MYSSTWQVLPPGEQLPYAWDEPSLPHRLKVLLGIPGRPESFVSHEFYLDDIKSLPPIFIPTKAGRVTGRQLVSGLTHREHDKLQVYVSVRAVGPTRVLRFSDSKDADLESVEDHLQVL